MSVDARAITQRIDDSQELGSLHVGNVMPELYAPENMIARLEHRRSQAVTVHTREGYTLTCTPNQMLRAPTGWVAARNARDLVMRGYSKRVASNGRPLMLCDEATIEAIKNLVTDEQSGSLDLVLRCISLPLVQQHLLALGIYSESRRDVLLVPQPHAGMYARLVGLKRPSLQEFFLAGHALKPSVLPRNAQRQISELLGKQGLTDLKTNPLEMKELGELSTLVVSAELQTNEALRMVDLLRVLPAKDVFIRNMLVRLLLSQCTEEFVVRVVGLSNHERLDMVQLTGCNYMANSFICKGT